jgi:hypothetical protein
VALNHKYFIVTTNYSIDQLFVKDPMLAFAIRERFDIKEHTH